MDVITELTDICISKLFTNSKTIVAILNSPMYLICLHRVNGCHNRETRESYKLTDICISKLLLSELCVHV